jgi:hypothetical protein
MSANRINQIFSFTNQNLTSLFVIRYTNSNKEQSDATTNNQLSPHQHKISLAA